MCAPKRGSTRGTGSDEFPRAYFGPNRRTDRRRASCDATTAVSAPCFATAVDILQMHFIDQAAQASSRRWAGQSVGMQVENKVLEHEELTNR